MRIKDIVCAKGRTGFFFDDQKAIKSGAICDGANYIGKTLTKGFKFVRQAGEAISVMIILEDGQIAYGDCAAVQYSGTGGRDPLFLAEEFMPVIKKRVAPLLIGEELNSFRRLAEKVDKLINPDTGKRIHTALRYGITQALLNSVAKSKGLLMTEVIAHEYNLSLINEPIPIFTQSGDDRYHNADKMIIKGADILPHGLINNVSAKLGYDGELLLEYLEWLKKRIEELKPYDNYMPIIHMDVYGTIGLAFDNDFDKIIKYFRKLEKSVHPYQIRIEGPVDMEAKVAQIEALSELTNRIDNDKMNLKIVADEWCNTLQDVKDFVDNRAGHIIQVKTPDLGGINNSIEAVLYCKRNDVGAYQGGTCNETDFSARTCVHMAMATQPDQILAKPGMGVDEGFMIVYNEMQRILALLKAKNEGGKLNEQERIASVSANSNFRIRVSDRVV